MKIYRLMITVAILVFSGAEGAKSLAQSTGSPGGSVTETEREPNRSGIAEEDSGSFEASEDQGPVGRNAEDVREMLQELRGTERRQKRANMNVENLNRRRNARNRRQSQRNPPPPIHIQFQPSFSLQRAPVELVADRLELNLSRLLEQRDAGAVRVVLSDRTATLTGSVTSEYQRRLLERMVRIEPGVSTVENLIAVEEYPLAPAP